MLIAPADIVIGDNVRKGLVEEASPSLVASIKEHGIIEPLAVVWHFENENEFEKGHWLLVAGHRRLTAALELELAEVPVHEVKPTNAADVIGMQVAENQEREGLSVWELAQAAWDLKSEGLKQAEVAVAMTLPAKEVSRLQKVAKVISQDTEVDDLVLDGFDLESLELLASDERPEVAISDVLMQYVDNDDTGSWAIDAAQRDAAAEKKEADFYYAVADELNMLAEKGVPVLAKDPRKKISAGGSLINDLTVARIGKEPTGYNTDNWLDLPLDTHVLEECHAVLIYIEHGYRGSNPELIHLCVDVKRHAEDGKSEVKAKDAGSVAKKKIAASAERKAAKLATEERFVKAALWIKTINLTEMREMAIDLAVKTKREDDYRTFARILGYIGERPKGADYGWYKERFDQYCVDNKATKDGSPTQHRKLMVSLLTVLPYVTDGWGRTTEHDDEIDKMEVPNGESV